MNPPDDYDRFRAGERFDPEEGTEPVGVEEVASARMSVEEARELVLNLTEKIRADPGVPVGRKMIVAFASLQDEDKETWLRVEEVLRRTKKLTHVRNALKHFRLELRPYLRLVRDGDLAERVTIGVLIDDCPPGAAGLVVPYGYYLEPHATGRIHSEHETASGRSVPSGREEIAKAVVVITSRLTDIDTGTAALRLSWRWARSSTWSERVVDRDIALDAKKLVLLAGKDFPVGSATASAMARYLLKFDEANHGALNGPRLSGHLGWQGPSGRDGFLLGRTFFPPDGGDPFRVDLRESLPEALDPSLVLFRGGDGGDDQIADAFEARGTLDAWKAAVAPIKDHPRALLAFYAAFVPPMLQILGAANFIADLSSRTSLGKTTALQCAASIWGSPERAGDASVMTSWDSTGVALERRAAVMSSLPFIVDDTKRVKGPEQLAAALFMLANGRGRDRGSLAGLSLTRSFRTVAISSGEAPATSFTEDGGTRSRVLPILGAPFGGEGDELGRLVEGLERQVCANFGHAGRLFVQELQQRRSEWPLLRAAYQAAVARFAARTGNAIVRRSAAYAAAIETAGRFAHEAVGLPWAYTDPFSDEMWEDAKEAASEAPPEVRGIRMLCGWCHSNAHRFRGRAPKDDYGNERAPPSGWAGSWSPGRDPQPCAIYPFVAKQILESAGFDPAEAVFTGARARRWLQVDTDRARNTKSVRIDGAPHRMIVLAPLAFIETVGSGSEAEEVPTCGDEVGTADYPEPPETAHE